MPTQVEVTAITESIGARLSGVAAGDLAREDVVEATRNALDAHGVVVFDEIGPSDAELAAFARRLGEVVIAPMGNLEEHPEISPISLDPGQSTLAAYRKATVLWHMDGTTYDAPDKATLLTARRLAAPGEGDTEFATTYAAWAALPDEEQARLEGLRVRHSLAASQRRFYANPLLLVEPFDVT